MNLTPIKGRGKGPRKAGFKPPNPKRLKLGNGQESSQAVIKKRTTGIEDLPKEILLQILMYSGEFNFPKASLRIGAALSHSSFYVDFVLKAFEPTWDQYLGAIKARVVSYHGWFEDRARFPGDPAAQSAVLALPFMTLKVIHAAMNRWAHRNRATPRHYQHYSDYNELDYCDEEELSDDEAHGFSEGVTGEGHQVRHDHIEDAAACFKEEFTFHCYNTDRRVMFHTNVWGGGEGSRVEVHPDVRIPDRLITGPWKWEDVKLLWWLVHNNAVIDPSTQSWDMVKRGISNLFDADDLEVANIVLICFAIIGAFKNWPANEPPISIERAYQKVIDHRKDNLAELYDQDTGVHPLASWKALVDGLFDEAKMEVAWAVEWMVKYKIGLYHQRSWPWAGLNSEWKR